VPIVVPRWSRIASTSDSSPCSTVNRRDGDGCIDRVRFMVYALKRSTVKMLCSIQWDRKSIISKVFTPNCMLRVNGPAFRCCSFRDVLETFVYLIGSFAILIRTWSPVRNVWGPRYSFTSVAIKSWLSYRRSHMSYSIASI
jgi:hypothetical protein